MNRGWLQLLAWVLVLGEAHLVVGQDVFSLSIDGPSSITKPFGFAEETYHVLLGHTGTGPGAQAWSFGVKNWECSVVAVTTKWTAADTVDGGGFRRGGFERTTTYYFGRPLYRFGAVSTVVLSLADPTALPANSVQKVATMEVEFDVGDHASTARLSFTDDYDDRDGLPPLTVTQAAGARVHSTGTETRRMKNGGATEVLRPGAAGGARRETDEILRPPGLHRHARGGALRGRARRPLTHSAT